MFGVKKNIVYRLQDQRAKLAPSLELRRAYILAASSNQLRSEKHAIKSRISRLQPGLRRVILAGRLQKLNALLQ